MEEIDIHAKLAQIETAPHFSMIFDGDTEKAEMIAEHLMWLHSIRRERPLVSRPYKVGIYIRYFNQTRYNNYLDFHKKLSVGTHIGGNHHAVQTVGHIDQVCHGDKLVCEALFTAQILQNTVYNGALTAIHGIQPLGKEVQFIQSGAVQPETRQLGKGAAMLNADITDTVRIRIPIGPFLCFRDFFCTGRQVKVCITIAGFIFSNQLNQNLFAHAHTSLHRHSEVLGFFHRRLCHNEKAVFI